jgi:hypothetical protein
LTTEKLGVRDPGRFLGGTGGTGGTPRVSNPIFDYYIKRFSLDEWILETDPTANLGTSLNVVEGGCGGAPLFTLNIHNTKAWPYLLPLPQQDLTTILRFVDLDHNLLSRLHKLHSITFLDFSDLLANPPDKYKEYVKRLGYGHLADTAELDEIRPIRAKICVNGNVVYVPRYSRKNELIKKSISRRSSVNRLINQIYRLREKIGSDYMLNFTLTVPTWLINPENIEADVQKVRKALKMFVRRVEKEIYGGSRLGGCYNVHIWSSERLTPYIHIHMHMLNVCQDKNGEFHRFRPYYSREQLEAIRKIWKDCLIKSGYSIAENIELDIYIDYVKLENRALVFHKLKYSARSPLIDLVRYFILNDKEPDITDQWAETIIFYENRRSVFGFFRNLKRIIGEVSEKTRHCPVCGSEIDEVVESLHYGEWERMFKEGKHIIVFFDPKTRKYKAIINAAREECLAIELLYSS